VEDSWMTTMDGSSVTTGTANRVNTDHEQRSSITSPHTSLSSVK